MDRGCALPLLLFPGWLVQTVALTAPDEVGDISTAGCKSWESCLLAAVYLVQVPFLCSNCSLVFTFQENEVKLEYRVWNPFRSKLAAAILGGVDQIHMPPGSKVLYLGAASGTTVSHVADIVGPVSVVCSLAVYQGLGKQR